VTLLDFSKLLLDAEVAALSAFAVAGRQST
jgi:hypothetical protein